ncbi:MAG: demethoxyubiquinone hydroxylase family protein [Bdellovibrionales bacterium]
MPKTTAKRKSPARALPGSKAADATLARMLRVNQAGEYGAQRIYAGQLAVLGDSDIGDEIRHMAAQEDVHLAAFNKLLVSERVRPTVLQPIWHLAGFMLGAVTAAMGREAAMACTVAVEEVIVEHYEKQLPHLKQTRPDIARQVQKFKDEEDEHREIGLHHDAEKAVAYPLLRRLIRTGSKTAIWLSERV